MYNGAFDSSAVFLITGRWRIARVSSLVGPWGSSGIHNQLGEGEEPGPRLILEISFGPGFLPGLLVWFIAQLMAT